MPPQRHETPKHQGRHVNPTIPALPPGYMDLIYPSHHSANGTNSQPPRCCDTTKPRANSKTRKKHRQRSKKRQKIRHITGPNAHTDDTPSHRSSFPPNGTNDATYKHKVKGTTATPPRPSQLYKQNGKQQKGTANKKRRDKHRQISRITISDDTKIKPKTRPKSSKCQDRNSSPPKHTQHDINEKNLYRLLEIVVEDHNETQLSHRHNGHKPYRRFSRRPSNNEIHTLNRHKRHYFCMIQNYVQQYIDFALNTKNDHSATPMRNRLRYDTPGGAVSRGGGQRDFLPPRPHLPPSPLKTLTTSKASSAKSIFT
jgi:hypothetical protein